MEIRNGRVAFFRRNHHKSVFFRNRERNIFVNCVNISVTRDRDNRIVLSICNIGASWNFRIIIVRIRKAILSMRTYK